MPDGATPSERAAAGRGGIVVVQPDRDLKVRDNPVHGKIREEEHEGDLAEDGADNVEGLELDELVPPEPEVFIHARDVGIVCVVC